MKIQNKIRILDIVIDEKFIDLYIQSNIKLAEYEVHDYIIIQKEYRDFKFLKSDQIKRISTDRIDTLLKTHSYDAVFLHSFQALPLTYIYRYKWKAKLFWFSWGFDIYEHPRIKPLIPYKLYHEETQKYIDNRDDKKMFKVTNYINIKKLKGIAEYLIYKKAISKIDYHSGILPYETGLLKRYLKNFRASQVHFNYIDIQNIPTFQIPKGNNILVGNSPALTNNHLDIIPYLQKIDTSNIKIIVPLNYGGEQDYINKVVSEYSKYFGSSFVPLINFIPTHEYFKIIDSCSSAIFMLERQQAIGNIIYCLSHGVKVFLSDTSDLYKFYKDCGYKIYSIQKDLNQQNYETNMPIKDMKNNYYRIKASLDNWLRNRLKITDIIRNN